MQIGNDQVQACIPTCKNVDGVSAYLNTYFAKYGIITADEIAAFMAQCGHESMDFNVFQENLNYSADALKRMWPKRFPDDNTANAYARNQEKIANKVYADRMGNGNELSGDGWRYRGSGIIQLTGKDNHSNFSKACGKSIVDVSTYMRTVEGAIESGCWYWKTNNLNKFADKDDIEGLTKAINGGTIGLDDRKIRFVKCLKIMKA